MNYLFISFITFLLTISLSFLGSLKGPYFMGYPTLMLISITGYLIHYLIFIPSYLFKTEKFYDITGTISYLVMSFIALISLNQFHLRSKILVFLVIVWALRLGIFLLLRVFDVGEDRRFKDVKTTLTRFLMWFSISALWVFLTTFNAFTTILSNDDSSLDIFFNIGMFIWLIGFLFEVVADEQKRRFRKNEENNGKFISSGLWSLSRHPNYFGEILIWIGIFIISIPVLEGWQFLSIISPLFVILLLTKVSGVNLLEESAEKRWGKDKKYQLYRDVTPVLMPFVSKKNKKTSN